MHSCSLAICTFAVLSSLNLTSASGQQLSQNTARGQSSASSDVQYYQEYQTVAIPTPANATLRISQPAILGSNLTKAFRREQLVVKPNSKIVNNQLAALIKPDPANDLVVPTTDIQIVGASQELEQIIRKVIYTHPGRETSQSHLQKDIAAILHTGLFNQARVASSSTSKGLSVVFEVEPVKVKAIELAGAKVLTPDLASDRFQAQLGNSISPARLNQAVTKIDQWYADNGYKLARVLSVQTNPDGVLLVTVAEGVVENVKFRFVDEKGKPIVGRTQTDFLRRELKVKPGEVFQENLAKQDLHQLYSLGLFQNVNLALEGDAEKVDVIYKLTESSASAFNVGGGWSNDSGIFGTVTFTDKNVGGVSDRFGVNVLASFQDLQFNANFTSPYRDSNPDRLGYNINAFRRRGISQTFDGSIDLPNDDDPRESQFGGSIELQRPLDDWQAALGLNYLHTSISDGDGDISPRDQFGNPLSFSGTGIDELTTLSFTAIKDKRDHHFYPTQGSLLNLSMEQSIPIGRGDISMQRLRASYSKYFPVQLLRTQDPEVFAINLQGGITIGDLPPYEAFNLGGVNSVRGYGSSDVGSGRSYILASAEYRFPIFDFAGGVVFADFASDLGSGDTVLGEPGVVRGKPGSGFGYGAGVRFDSPIGIIRAELGFNNQGESRLQFGIGQRF